MARGPHRSFAPLPDSGAAFRAYAPKELAKLDAECRGLLIYFEQSGILTPQTREHVIERALAATGDGLTLEQLKLVVLMVLWNQQTPSSRLIAEDLLSPATARASAELNARARASAQFFRGVDARTLFAGILRAPACPRN